MRCLLGSIAAGERVKVKVSTPGREVANHLRSKIFHKYQIEVYSSREAGIYSSTTNDKK